MRGGGERKGRVLTSADNKLQSTLDKEEEEEEAGDFVFARMREWRRNPLDIVTAGWRRAFAYEWPPPPFLPRSHWSALTSVHECGKPRACTGRRGGRGRVFLPRKSEGGMRALVVNVIYDPRRAVKLKGNPPRSRPRDGRKVGLPTDAAKRQLVRFPRHLT